MHNTKLCFKHKSNNITCYPNFSLRNNNLSNQLPKDKIHKLQQNSKIIRQAYNYEQMHLKISEKVFQLILIFKIKDQFQCFASTGFFLKFHSYIFAASVLHIIQNQGQLQYCLINITKYDLAYRIKKLINKWKKYNFNKQMKAFISKNYPEIFLIQNIKESKFSKSFFFFRRKYLSLITNVRQLMVPQLILHALPSIDFLPFKLPVELVDKLSAQKNYFELQQYTLTNQLYQSELLFMIGYQNNNQIIDLSSDDYCMIKTNQNTIECKKFVNADQSLSICEFQSKTNYLIVFKGSTLQGSSGSPIYNQHGRLLGLNFGYISDKTEEYTLKQSDKIYEYELNLTQYQKRSSYKKQKNFNVAIRIDCDIIKDWLNSIKHLQIYF